MSRVRERVAAESEGGFFDKLSNRELWFREAGDEIVVTLNHHVEVDFENVGGEPVAALVKGADFTILRVQADWSLEGATISLYQRGWVRNAMPAVIDDEGLKRYFLPDEFTIQSHPGVPRDRIEQLADQHGTWILEEHRIQGYFTLAVPKGKALFGTIQEFCELNEVKFAEPSEVGLNDSLSIDDSEFGRLWAFENKGQKVGGVEGTPGADIQVLGAWKHTLGSPRVVIAVIDSGADLDHPDLASNLLDHGSDNWNFGRGASPAPDDTDGHGTKVAGVAAASANRIGVRGTAPECKVMPLRIDLNSAKYTRWAEAIDLVAKRAGSGDGNRYIVNCSWKMQGKHNAVHQAIKKAVKNGALVICAAGNSELDIDTNPFYPAVYPEVMAVAATDQHDQKVKVSNYGSSRVSVAAPGKNILSTKLGGGFGFGQNTSMAAPLVAGVAALVWSLNFKQSNNDVRETLELTCDSLATRDPTYGKKLGYGRVNAARAVEKVLDEMSIVHSMIGNEAFGRAISGDLAIELDKASSIEEFCREWHVKWRFLAIRLRAIVNVFYADGANLLGRMIEVVDRCSESIGRK